MLPFLMVRSLLSLSISRSRCAPGSYSLQNPFLATRASHLRRTQNRTTSNPQSANVDAVDAASSLSPLPATLTKSTRGGVYLFPPKNLFSSFSRLLARHSSLATKSFTIRTSGKHLHNPIRMCTSKTKHLKLFRMSTYRKKGRGVGPAHSGRFLGSPAWVADGRHEFVTIPSGTCPPGSALLLHCLWLKRLAEQGTACAIAEGAKMRRGIPGRRMWRVPRTST
jgi:hypothetical protein